jgi:exosome complex component RRP41
MQNHDIVSLGELRIDGRKYHEVRKMNHNIGLNRSADGSAYLEVGLNKVLVLIQGPEEVRKKNDQSSEKVKHSLLFIL